MFDDRVSRDADAPLTPFRILVKADDAAEPTRLKAPDILVAAREKAPMSRVPAEAARAETRPMADDAAMEILCMLPAARPAAVG